MAPFDKEVKKCFSEKSELYADLIIKMFFFPKKKTVLLEHWRRCWRNI